MNASTLKDVREKLALPVEAMSALLGTGLRTYYRYEAGTSQVPLCVESHIITLLNNPNYLMSKVAALKGTGPRQVNKTDGVQG